MDVLSDAQDILSDLGVHFESSASEATAAATLAASVMYPIRGAVTFKAPVGINVASDALANLSSGGVTGGALIIIGEDYGEGSSIMQERSHAFAMKSQLWLVDPRPNVASIVKAVHDSFELSEASNTPVMLEVRIRACHVHGRFATRDNVRPSFPLSRALDAPSRDTNRIVLPPASFLHEKEKIEHRWPAAVEFIHSRGMNETFEGDIDDIGIIMQGGMYNGVITALREAGLADIWGETRVPLYVMNVTYPIVDREVIDFCRGKKAVLMVEEGQPEFIEQALHKILRNADIPAKLHGKDLFPMAGEYTAQVMGAAIGAFIRRWRSDALPDSARAPNIDRAEVDDKIRAMAAVVPPRPPGLGHGVAERPIFSAMKLVEKELGPHHIAADIGCHLFSILPPFNIGATTMGYGLGPASASAFNVPAGKRSISMMGDGGFWHNGLTSGVGNAVFNQHDGVIVVVDNYYSAATGGQDIPSSRADNRSRSTKHPIVEAVKGVGAKWVRQIDRTYDVTRMRDTLREALTTEEKGPKIIVASSECMLNKQRRVKPLVAAAAKRGERIVRERFGVDEDVCSGDHACIRLSGCPSLSVKPTTDPLKDNPVAAVDNSCVGCGHCGEGADAAVLCPSFYRADIVSNPTALEAPPDRHPVLSLMPAPGKVDIVVGAELMEAGRAILRGLVSPDRTLLIGSSHRSLAVVEKTAPGDGTADASQVYEAANVAANRFIAFDMAEIADATGSVVSSVLFGALAGSGALPFTTEDFEATIRSAGVGVDASLRAFTAGRERAVATLQQDPKIKPTAKPPLAKRFPRLEPIGHAGYDALVARARQLPEALHGIVAAGLQRVVDYQDVAYGREYLDRLEAMPRDATGLMQAFAKYLAIVMAYDDVIRVADLKTRAGRFDRVRREARAGDDQILGITEFFHPRIEEMAGLLPPRLGEWIERSERLARLIDRGRKLRTTAPSAFLMLYCVAGLRRFRRRTLRHTREMRHLGAWSQRIRKFAASDTALATAVCEARRLVGGYSDTHSRSETKFDKVMQASERLAGRPDAAEWVQRLIKVALKDADGAELDGALRTVETLFEDA